MIKESLNIVFAGTPKFAVPTLDLITNSDHNVSLVLTQPDRRAGRGMSMVESDVKKYAREKNLQILQPEKISDSVITQIEKINPDLLVVAAYGIILPANLLKIFPKGAFNVHGSILPKWRGAAPIQRAIESGDKIIGVSIMEVVEKLDAGRICKIYSEERDVTKSSGYYFERLALKGSELMLDWINLISSNTRVEMVNQDESKVTYAKKIFKEEAVIDWNEKAEIINNKVHALNPNPMARCQFRDRDYKIVKTEISNIKNMEQYNFGDIYIESKKLYIKAKENFLEILELQPPGSKIISAEIFIKNYQVKNKEKFS
jgi:methionyl-tRNA formyltransferase